METNTLGFKHFNDVVNNTTMVNYTVELTTISYLDRYNEERLSFQLPAIIYSGLMMIVGLLGNMVVFYVYLFKWRKSTSRIFILYLAALDMINCATTIPMEIYIMRYSVKCDKPLLCKLSRFSTYTMNSSSALILVGIALDRFTRICRPYQRSFSEPLSRRICIGAIVLAICLTWPSLVLYGTRIIDLGQVKGQACLTENTYDKTPYPIIYFGIMATMTLVVFATLAILYYFVGLQLYKHSNFKMKNCTHVQEIVDDRSVTVTSENEKSSNDKYKPSSKADTDGHNATENGVNGVPVINLPTEDENSLAPYQLGLPKPMNDVGTSCGMLDVPYAQNGDLSKDRIVKEMSTKDKSISPIVVDDLDILNQPVYKQNNIFPKKVSQKLPKQKVRRRTRRVRYLLVRGSSTLNASGSEKCTNCLTVRIGKSTLMLFLITIAYVLSFLPFYTILILRQSDVSFVKKLSHSGNIAYHVFLRSYLLSSAINPIIYSFCNLQFREHCIDLFQSFEQKQGVVQKQIKIWTKMR